VAADVDEHHLSLGDPEQDDDTILPGDIDRIRPRALSFQWMKAQSPLKRVGTEVGEHPKDRGIIDD